MKPARVRAWVVACSLAMAIWLSDQWFWMVPGLLGVVVGAGLAGLPGEPEDGLGSWWSALGTVLIIVGFVYLYVAFLILQISKMQDLDALGELPGPPLRLWGGTVFLSVLIAGLGGFLLFNLRIPRWVARLWKALLEQR